MRFSRMLSLAAIATLGAWPAMPIMPGFEFGPKNYSRSRSRHLPHQRERECARRARQMAAR